MLNSSVAQPLVNAKGRTIRTHGLSYQAIDYLRVVARNLRLEGKSATEVAAELNAWAAGYRKYAQGGCVTDATEHNSAANDGYAYATGENAYWLCISREGLAVEEPAA